MHLEPLGRLYLAAALRENGHQVFIHTPLNFKGIKSGAGYHYGATKEELSQLLLEQNPDVVGITCNNTFSLQGTELVANTAKRLLGGQTVTIAGGNYPSVYKGRVLEKCPSLDYALQGESEDSLIRLLHCLSSQKPDLKPVDGLVQRTSEGIETNPKTRFIEDLDQIPFPARDLVDLPPYMNSRNTLYGLGYRPTLSLINQPFMPQAVQLLQYVDGARQKMAGKVHTERYCRTR